MVLRPPAEPHPMGFVALAPVDRFLQRYRMPIVVTTILVVVLASPLLWFLRSISIRCICEPKVESVATFLELRKDPQAGANAIEIIAPDLSAADATAKR